MNNDLNFYIELTLMVVLLLLCLILTRITFKQYKNLKILQNTRIHIARDLHDEIGATLSSISFYGEACKMNLLKNNTDSAIQLIDKIGNSSRDTIHSMNDIVWMINPKNDHLIKMFERIEDFGKSIFISRGIQFYFYPDHELQHVVLPIEWRKNLFLIIKEALNNIAKYAEAKEVEVLIKRRHSLIEVVIKDNGTGFNADDSFSGNGLLNMRVRAGAMGSKLTIDSKSGRGTALSFNLPYPHKW